MGNEIVKRNQTIEVYRCCLMVGVCLLHSITQGGYVIRGLDNVLSTSVLGFVLISAWFGVSLKPSKIIRLIMLGAIYASFTGLCGVLFLASENVIELIKSAFKSYWFLWGYIFVMLCSPLVDYAVKGRSIKESFLIVVPIFFLVFVWGYSSSLPIISNWMPQGNWFPPLSGMTLLGVYVCARVIFENKINSMLNRWWLMLLTLPFVVLGFYHHNSPFAFLFALAVFLIFKDLRLPNQLCRFCALLSPSVFAIYLYHSTGVGFRALKSIEASMVDAGAPVFLVHIIGGVLIFVGGIVVDIPRRIFVCLCGEQIRRWTKNLDVWFMRCGVVFFGKIIVTGR